MGELRIELKRKKEGAYIGTLVATRRRAFKDFKEGLQELLKEGLKEGLQ